MNEDKALWAAQTGPPTKNSSEPVKHEQDSSSSDTVKQTDSSESVVPEDGGAAIEHEYPSGVRLLLLTLGLTLALFIVALDTSIIATAIPRITTIFVSLEDVGWYGGAYLLTTTSLQPSFGKIYTYFDTKWVFLTALFIFEVGSVICAAAPTSAVLILGRAVAGAGAAGVFSGTMTIIGYSVPLQKRALYLSLVASMNGIASVVGPILGGVFTDRLTWRWCFWINLPIGGVSIAIVLFCFANPPRPFADLTIREKLRQLDVLGAISFMSAIVCLLLALQWGGAKYAWSDSIVWGCFLGFGLIIILFIAVQFVLGDRSTMPPRLFNTQRTFAGCAVFTVLINMAMQTHVYYLPFYFQAVHGTSAESSGVRCIPYLVSMSVSSIVVGGTVTALGPFNPALWVGSALFTIGSGLLYTLSVGSSLGAQIGYQVLAGAGLGACMQIPFIAAQVVLPERDMPSGNAVMFFFTTLGGAISVPVAQNVFLNTLIKQVASSAPGADPTAVVDAGATHFREVVSPSLLPGAINAYSMAVTTAFILPITSNGLAFLVSFIPEWGSVKAKPAHKTH